MPPNEFASRDNAASGSPGASLTFAPVADKEAAARKLGLPAGRYIGCFGRIRHQKGTDAFVDAMIVVLARFPDHRAVVLGRATGPHVRYLNELKEKNNSLETS